MATAECREATFRLTNKEAFLAGKRVRLRVGVDCPACGRLFTGYYIEQRDEWEKVLEGHIDAGLEQFYAENPHLSRTTDISDLFPNLSL